MRDLPPIQIDYPLKALNTWKVGGSADFFGEPKNEKDVFYYLKWARDRKLDITFLGGGTNVLVSDQGVRGLVMSMKQLNTLQVKEKEGRLSIHALAGVSKAEIMQVFLKYKLSPALFLCGLPGEVGGGVVMNAGIGQKDISPRDFGDIVDWIKVIREDEVILISSCEIEWQYRSSRGWSPGLIYEVGMSWPLEPLPDLPARLREMALKRTQTQPLKSASCGSVFKNPVDEKSGKLIEQCGLKGTCVGKACVSKKHANFIINEGQARARDIHKLIEYVQRTVHREKGIKLEPEVKYLGEWTGG